jgi:seryl-tRNA synthetase
MYYIEAAGAAIKKDGYTALELVWAASTSETQEARELTKRWKTLFAKYANLSKRYWNNTRQFQALRMEPSQVRARYEALDEQFDDVCEQMEALYDDLAEWARSNPGIVRSTIPR